MNRVYGTRLALVPKWRPKFSKTVRTQRTMGIFIISGNFHADWLKHVSQFAWFVATVDGSIEFGAFDKIARSMELHVRWNCTFDSISDAREFSIEFENAALLITANLVLLVTYIFLKRKKR